MLIRKGQKPKTDPKTLAKNRASYAKNKDKYKPTREKYQKANRERIRRQKKEYNSEPRNKKRHSEWNNKNTERRKNSPIEAQKMSEEKERTKQKLRNEIFNEYSRNKGTCYCCGKCCKRAWDLDHSDGSGKVARSEFKSDDSYFRHLRRNKFPNKNIFHVMCCNCNQAREKFDHRPSDHKKIKYERNLQRGPKRWWKHKALEHKTKLECITAYCKHTSKKFMPMFLEEHPQKFAKGLGYEDWLKSPCGKFITSVLDTELRCEVCKVTWFDFLTMNHTRGGGGKERKKGKIPEGKTLFSYLRARHFPDREKWNILCFNCQRVDKNMRIERRKKKHSRRKKI